MKNKKKSVIKSIEASENQGWFVVNEDVEITFFVENDDIKMDVAYDEEKYSTDEIQILGNELFEIIITNIEEKGKN